MDGHKVPPGSEHHGSKCGGDDDDDHHPISGTSFIAILIIVFWPYSKAWKPFFSCSHGRLLYIVNLCWLNPKLGSWSPNFPCFNLPFCWWKLPCLLLPPGPNCGNCGNPLQVSSLKSAERLELLSELQCLAKLRHPHLCGSLGSSLVFRSGNKQGLGNWRSKKGNWDWIRNWIWNSSPAGFNK